MALLLFGLTECLSSEAFGINLNMLSRDNMIELLIGVPVVTMVLMFLVALFTLFDELVLPLAFLAGWLVIAYKIGEAILS